MIVWAVITLGVTISVSALLLVYINGGCDRISNRWNELYSKVENDDS